MPIRPKDDAPWGCLLLWIGFVLVANAAWIGVLIWLVITLIHWLGRH